MELSSTLKALRVFAVVYTKMVQSIQMLLRAKSCKSNKAYIIWDQGWTNPFTTARGDKMVMQPFVKILGRILDHLVLLNQKKHYP